MVYKISEIVKEIKESLPKETFDKYWQDLKAKNVNIILEEENLLYRDGKYEHPTPRGIQSGIFEELRTKQDTGEQYYQVLYTEEAKNLVIKILYSNFPEIDPDIPEAYEIMEYSALSDSDRNAAHQIVEKYDCPIVLLKNGDIFSVYDEGALQLCEILKPEYCHIDNNDPVIKIKPCDLQRYVIPALKTAKVSFAVNETVLKVYKYLNLHMPQVPVMPEQDRMVRIGDLVTVHNSNGTERITFITRDEFRTVLISVDSDGDMDFNLYYRYERNGIGFTYVNSQLYDDLKRHRVGDDINSYFYSSQIIGIKRGNEIESIINN